MNVSGDYMTMYVKNMVCQRCIIVVSKIFADAGFSDAKVRMGEVVLAAPIPEEKLAFIQSRLNEVGFEIMNDAKGRVIEQIKKLSIDYVYIDQNMQKESFSDYLSGHLNHAYNYLSSLYSSVEETTIENHLINLKIERVKELLVYDEKSLSEIAYEMGYSSVGHLSGQFKKITGFTPSNFRKIRENKRKSIDEI
jgi:AraC-like DNA-binding protein